MSGWWNPAWGLAFEPSAAARADWLDGWEVTTRDEGGQVTCDLRIPGVKPENVSIVVLADGMLVSAQHQEETEVRGPNTYSAAASVAAVTRAVPFPRPVRTGGARVAIRDGVIRVTVPAL